MESLKNKEKKANNSKKLLDKNFDELRKIENFKEYEKKYTKNLKNKVKYGELNSPAYLEPSEISLKKSGMPSIGGINVEDFIFDTINKLEDYFINEFSYLKENDAINKKHALNENTNLDDLTSKFDRKIMKLLHFAIVELDSNNLSDLFTKILDNDDFKNEKIPLKTILSIITKNIEKFDCSTKINIIDKILSHDCSKDVPYTMYNNNPLDLNIYKNIFDILTKQIPEELKLNGDLLKEKLYTIKSNITNKRYGANESNYYLNEWKILCSNTLEFAKYYINSHSQLPDINIEKINDNFIAKIGKLNNSNQANSTISLISEDFDKIGNYYTKTKDFNNSDTNNKHLNEITKNLVNLYTEVNNDTEYEISESVDILEKSNIFKNAHFKNLNSSDVKKLDIKVMEFIRCNFGYNNSKLSNEAVKNIAIVMDKIIDHFDKINDKDKKDVFDKIKVVLSIVKFKTDTNHQSYNSNYERSDKIKQMFFKLQDIAYNIKLTEKNDMYNFYKGMENGNIFNIFDKSDTFDMFGIFGIYQSSYYDFMNKNYIEDGKVLDSCSNILKSIIAYTEKGPENEIEEFKTKILELKSNIESLSRRNSSSPEISSLINIFTNINDYNNKTANTNFGFDNRKICITINQLFRRETEKEKDQNNLKDLYLYILSDKKSIVCNTLLNVIIDNLYKLNNENIIAISNKITDNESSNWNDNSSSIRLYHSLEKILNSKHIQLDNKMKLDLNSDSEKIKDYECNDGNTFIIKSCNKILDLLGKINIKNNSETIVQLDSIPDQSVNTNDNDYSDLSLMNKNIIPSSSTLMNTEINTDQKEEISNNTSDVTKTETKNSIEHSDIGSEETKTNLESKEKSKETKDVDHNENGNGRFVTMSLSSALTGLADFYR